MNGFTSALMHTMRPQPLRRLDGAAGRPARAAWLMNLMKALLPPLVIALAALPVDAQESRSSAAARPKPPASGQPGSGAKPATTPAQKARAAARKATVAAGAAGAATATALALADEDQRHAYTLTHLGDYECEFKRAVRVVAHPVHEGYVDLYFDKRVITARPVLSSTGAVRLEDIRGRYLMVQIAFKSMLMDTRVGQRVADDCVHDKHHEARRAAAQAPAEPGLGIAAPAPEAAAASTKAR